jgi:hypothetical protein
MPGPRYDRRSGPDHRRQRIVRTQYVEGSTRQRWYLLFPERGAGHVVHEWRNRASGQSVVLGLAAVRSHDRLECCRYSLRLRPGLELRSLPLAEHSSSLDQTRRCLNDAADPEGGAKFFTAAGKAWRVHLESFGLGAASVHLAGEDAAGRRWMADPAAFAEEAVRRLAPAAVVPEFAGADGSISPPNRSRRGCCRPPRRSCGACGPSRNSRSCPPVPVARSARSSGFGLLIRATRCCWSSYGRWRAAKRPGSCIPRRRPRRLTTHERTFFGQYLEASA